MSKNRIKLNICGTDYVIISDENEEYMVQISREVDEEMQMALKSNSRLSVTMSAVLTALKYCDEGKKFEMDADNLRNQIKDYLEESVGARMQADEARSEVLRLEKEVEVLKERIRELEDFEMITPVYEKKQGDSEQTSVNDETKDHQSFFEESFEKDEFDEEADEAQRLIRLFAE